MKWFPINIKLEQRHCIVVGAGPVAHRKISLLLRSNTRITVIAPQLCAQLQQELADHTIEVIQANFDPKLEILASCNYLFAAAPNDINIQVAQFAAKHNIPINVADNAALSTFILPAIIDRAPVTIAISTSGTVPMLARYIKSKIEVALPANIASLANRLSKIRNKLKAKITDPLKLRTAFYNILDGNTNNEFATSSVFIIGAGPGDPELLTLKAYRILQNCDVVLYDNLIAEQTLEYVRRDAQKIYVGKKAGNHSCKQNDITALLIKYAQQDLCVVRLKGGDPLLFARFAEEAQALTAHNISFTVIPGITAASGCAAALQIPLTERLLARGCVFITAHTLEQDAINWQALSSLKYTLVFYMPLAKITEITTKLVEHGLQSETPVALIEQGTSAKEKSLISTIGKLAREYAQHNFGSPTLLIIGDVIKHHSSH